MKAVWQVPILTGLWLVLVTMLAIVRLANLIGSSVKAKPARQPIETAKLNGAGKQDLVGSLATQV